MADDTDSILDSEYDDIDLREVNVDSMNKLEGFDIVIICTGNEKQASYWQERLENGKGVVIGKHTKVLSVSEDWTGGAGNALGTLYAFQNACSLSKQLHEFDLLQGLREESISVGLFHTAGRGTRLAPLPGSENNNKPGVKLGTTVDLGDGSQHPPMTILEAVVKQAGVYARSRKGRLSVFWGDQVFIPSAAVDYEPTHHIDILCRLGPMLSRDEWVARGMEKYYGLIAVDKNNNAAQVEKVPYDLAREMLRELGDPQRIGTSLGSFSVSHHMLDTLVNEFSDELATRRGQLNSDQHWWMPLGLPRPAYITLMAQKGVPEPEARAHHARMKAMVDRFWKVQGPSARGAGLGLLGAVDVGQGAYWWDYGQLRLYFLNNMLMTQDTVEADCLRRFLGVRSRVRRAQLRDVEVDAGSVVQACALGRGSVRSSVLAHVRCDHVEAEYCILINVTAKSIKAPPGSLIYNVIDESQEGIDLAEGGVLAGVMREDDTQLLVRSMTHIDGGKSWHESVEGNLYSFEEIQEMNAESDVKQIEQRRARRRTRAWRRVNAHGGAAFDLDAIPEGGHSRPYSSYATAASVRSAVGRALRRPGAARRAAAAALVAAAAFGAGFLLGSLRGRRR